MRSAPVILFIALCVIGSGVEADGQLPSSSSGLVFPGPPRRKSGEPEAAALQRSGYPRPATNPQRSALPVPLSLIGQQPEEFVAAAQRRQQQAAAQQAAAQRAAQQTEEEREQDEEEAEEPVRPQPPPVQRRQEVQRPEPSINQAVQQRRPNYPGDYKPRPQQGGEGPRRPPNSINEQVAEQEEPAEEEEEEVKPDKLQILLQKSQFSCTEKKDGYYADEGVDCEIFHYCQDKTRHSWLCPEGATFHQVHLLCMPVGKDNICDKSSQFHFVNDYLYKTVDNEDGTNSSSGIYADRYYPEGYEQGKDFDMSEVLLPDAGDRPNLQPFNRRHQTDRPDQRQRRPVHHQQQGQNRERPGNNENRRLAGAVRRPAPAPEPQIPERIEDDEDQEQEPQSETPVLRSSQDAFDRRGRPQPAEEMDEDDE